MIIAALLLAAAPTAASPLAASPMAAEPAVTSVADPKAKDDPLVCRREKVIGSLLQAKKTCMRQSEWAAQREFNRQEIERAQLQRPTKE